jgi:hypothetical protein
VARFVADRQAPSSFGTPGGKHTSSVFGAHSLAKAVFVFTAAIAGLECPFHFLPT